MNTFTPSDEQVIARVRKAQRYRRPLGALCALIGLTGIELVAYWVHDLQAQSTAPFNELARAPQPTTQQVAQSVDQSRFSTGFSLGFMAAAGFAGAVECAAFGLVWILVRNRKDRLLLQCWGEVKTGRL